MKRNNTTKKEITLMTLIANEATADARKLLKKYNKADAKDCADLEMKLAQLYFATSDKIEIEKDLAAIHPHKNWILKRTKVEEVEKPIEIPQTTSNAEGECCNPNCPVHGKCTGYSNADAAKTTPIPLNQDNRDVTSVTEDYRMNPYHTIVPIIGLVAVVGFITYLLKTNK
jgi:hypothetical protein